MDGQVDEQTIAARLGAVMGKVDAAIEGYGFFVSAVFPTLDAPEYPSFAYTTGFEKSWGHPEVLIVGLPAHVAHGVMHEMADRIKAGEVFEAGKRYSKLFRDFDAELRTVEEPGYPLNIARRYYGRDIAALQLVWPDEAGLFPGEEGCDEEMMKSQPLANGRDEW